MSDPKRKRLCQFERDILFVLEKEEPGVLLWREIKARLELVHRHRYQDDKTYGVALSYYLGRLDGKFIKKFGDHWGTLKSSLPKKLQTEQKPQTSEINVFNITPKEKYQVVEDYDLDDKQKEAFSRLRLKIRAMKGGDPLERAKANALEFYLDERERLSRRVRKYVP